MQYVGITEQCLHHQINCHRSSVRSGNSTFLYEHFNQEDHCFDDVIIRIIDKVDDSVENKKELLLEKELYWINILNSAFPLGLNGNIKNAGNVSNTAYLSSSNIYFRNKLPRCKRGHGVKKENAIKEIGNKNNGKKDIKNVDKITTKEKMKSEMERLKELFTNNRKLNFNRKLKSYSTRVLNGLSVECGGKHGLFYSVLNSFITHPPPTPLPSNDMREVISIVLSSKAYDNINVSSIFRDTKISSYLPDGIKDKLPLKIFYSYDPPLSRKIFNYSSFLKVLDIDSLKDIVHKDCSCKTSPFCYSPHNHILTGDLSIIINPKLRALSLMQYGTKYREAFYQSSDNITTSFNTSVDNFVNKICKKYYIKNELLKEWIYNVQRIFAKRVEFLLEAKPHLFKEHVSILKDKDIINYIEQLHKDFVICSIDKAANNYVIICKKFYVLTLMKELGIDPISYVCQGSIAYQLVDLSEDNMVKGHCKFLKEKFDIVVSKVNEKIPRIFWNPKLHKNPYKARFIAGARNSSTKQLSVYLNRALAVLKARFSCYCKSIYERTGINCDWSIDNSIQFIEHINNLDLYNLQVYHFTTLYTNLDLGVIETLVNEMIDLIFNKSFNKYLCVERFGDRGFFSKKSYNGFLCFIAETLKGAIRFILNNTYISFSGFVLKQVRGIPMGGNSSSQLADVPLSKSEFNYQLSLVKDKKFNLAKRLSNNKRYVDDLGVINYTKFASRIPEIYPPDLLMERSGNDNKFVNYLDIAVNIYSHKVTTKMYNKVDDFNFEVVSFTFPHSNISISIGYNLFYSQLIRYYKICSEVQDFIHSSRKLYRELSLRGYSH